MVKNFSRLFYSCLFLFETISCGEKVLERLNQESYSQDFRIDGTHLPAWLEFQNCGIYSKKDFEALQSRSDEIGKKELDLSHREKRLDEQRRSVEKNNEKLTAQYKKQTERLNVQFNKKTKTLGLKFDELITLQAQLNEERKTHERVSEALKQLKLEKTELAAQLTTVNKGFSELNRSQEEKLDRKKERLNQKELELCTSHRNLQSSQKNYEAVQIQLDIARQSSLNEKLRADQLQGQLIDKETQLKKFAADLSNEMCRAGRFEAELKDSRMDKRSSRGRWYALSFLGALLSLGVGVIFSDVIFSDLIKNALSVVLKRV